MPEQVPRVEVSIDEIKAILQGNNKLDLGEAKMENSQAYIQGNRAAWNKLLHECLRNLGVTECDKYGWITERESSIAILREICDEFGDNDWDGNLHLADIIDKHLGNHLFKLEINSSTES